MKHVAVRWEQYTHDTNAKAFVVSVPDDWADDKIEYASCELGYGEIPVEEDYVVDSDDSEIHIDGEATEDDGEPVIVLGQEAAGEV